MSREEEEEEKKLQLYLKKYEIVVKQFDVLVDMMDARSKPPPKRRRGTKGSSSTSNDPAASANQPNNEVFVQTVRNFLDELRSCNTTTADHNCSTSNPNQG